MKSKPTLTVLLAFFTVLSASAQDLSQQSENPFKETEICENPGLAEQALRYSTYRGFQRGDKFVFLVHQTQENSELLLQDFERFLIPTAQDQITKSYPWDGVLASLCHGALVTYIIRNYPEKYRIDPSARQPRLALNRFALKTMERAITVGPAIMLSAGVIGLSGTLLYTGYLTLEATMQDNYAHQNSYKYVFNDNGFQIAAQKVSTDIVVHSNTLEAGQVLIVPFKKRSLLLETARLLEEERAGFKLDTFGEAL